MPYGNSPVTRPPRPILRPRSEPYEPDVAPQGEWIENPFFQKTAKDKQRDRDRKRRTSSTTDAPPMIENPYLVSNESSRKRRDSQD